MWNGTGGCPSVISEMVTDVARDRESNAPPTDVDVEGVAISGLIHEEVGFTVQAIEFCYGYGWVFVVVVMEVVVESPRTSCPLR